MEHREQSLQLVEHNPSRKPHVKHASTVRVLWSTARTEKAMRLRLSSGSTRTNRFSCESRMWRRKQSTSKWFHHFRSECVCELSVECECELARALRMRQEEAVKPKQTINLLAATGTRTIVLVLSFCLLLGLRVQLLHQRHLCLVLLVPHIIETVDRLQNHKAIFVSIFCILK